jgi:hypothetical protein
VVDAHGDPVAGVDVYFSAPDGGTFDPPHALTDASGEARAWWTLGSASEQHAVVTVDGAPQRTVEAQVSVLPAGIHGLALSTADGSGQTVHPDYVAAPPTWPGSVRNLVLTPYPNGDASLENPSLYAGTDDIAWTAPPGLSNPLVRPTAGYLSDPDIVFVAERSELWIYYRHVYDRNRILLITSVDGVSFSTPRTVVEGDNHTLVSPAVVRRGESDWMMWTVNANVGCAASRTAVELRRSTDGVTWGPPAAVTLNQDGFSLWHIDVQWIPSRREFWAIYNVKTAASCTTPALYLATSSDGVAWQTYPSPVLMRGATDAFRDVVYRSTFAYDPGTDRVKFWYSGAKYDRSRYVWTSAFQERSRADLFATIAAKSSLADMAARTDVPPLLDAP